MYYIYGGVGRFGGTNIYSVRHCIPFLRIISSAPRNHLLGVSWSSLTEWETMYKG